MACLAQFLFINKMLKRIISLLLLSCCVALGQYNSLVPFPTFYPTSTNGSGGAGNFTTINVSVGIVGSTSGIEVVPGIVGEYVESTVFAGSGVTLTSGAAKNVTSLSLTAGDWDCTGNINFLITGTVTNTSSSIGCMSTTTDSILLGGETFAYWGQTNANILNNGLSLARKRINSSTNITVYLVGLATYSGAANAVTEYGKITARRMQ